MRLFVIVAVVAVALVVFADLARPLASSVYLGRNVPDVVSTAIPTVEIASHSMNVTSNGSFPTEPVVLNSTTAPEPEMPTLSIRESEPRRVIVVEDLMREYGAEVFPSVVQMPEDLRFYYLSVVEQVADFFTVRPEAMLALLQEADPQGGLRLMPPTSAEGSVRGVAQATPRHWNGWANPQVSEYGTDQRVIDQYGGIGFDWSLREEWRAWRQGRSSGSALRAASPDPDLFENSLAAVARHLVQWGLTTDATAQDEAAYQRRLADAISVYGGGQPLSATEYERFMADQGIAVSSTAGATDSSQPTLDTPVVVPELRSAFYYGMDQTFGVALSDADFAAMVDNSPIAAQVANGTISAQDGANQLVLATIERYLAEGEASLEDGEAMRWPFIHDATTLAAQKMAVQHLGHTLSPWELNELIQESRGNEGAMGQHLSRRSDARLFGSTRQFLDTALKRSERGLPVTTQEINALVQPVLATYPTSELSTIMLQAATDQIQYRVHLSQEYRELNGITQFAAMPLQPTPSRIIKRFGSPARYQTGGVHTGIDLRNPREGNQQPLLYAVDEATVVHVGPLYCNEEGKCRGPYAIILDHGNNIYSIYSHNSEASVAEGERVDAGQVIGRQGDLGYSMGPHLHFEVHIGAPYTGNWVVPFNGGEFVDPLPWLPPSALNYS